MVIEHRLHVASFKGKHNLAKAKAFLALYYQSLINTKPLTKEQIAENAAIPLGSVNVSDWCKYKYIKRVAVILNKRVRSAYRIDKRGEEFVIRRIPPDVYDKCMEQIKSKQHHSLDAPGKPRIVFENNNPFRVEK